jgi:hypothetical protein
MGSRPGWWMWDLWWTEAALGQVFIEFVISPEHYIIPTILSSLVVLKFAVK